MLGHARARRKLHKIKTMCLFMCRSVCVFFFYWVFESHSNKNGQCVSISFIFKWKWFATLEVAFTKRHSIKFYFYRMTNTFHAHIDTRTELCKLTLIANSVGFDLHQIIHSSHSRVNQKLSHYFNWIAYFQHCLNKNRLITNYFMTFVR